jgi:hypothetical protein
MQNKDFREAAVITPIIHYYKELHIFMEIKQYPKNQSVSVALRSREASTKNGVNGKRYGLL